MNSYTEHLMRCINQSKETAEKEFSTALQSASKAEMQDWYSRISEWISKNPPAFYVKYLEITENYNEKIKDIIYVYFEKNEAIEGASIRVISELFGG